MRIAPGATPLAGPQRAAFRGSGPGALNGDHGADPEGLLRRRGLTEQIPHESLGRVDTGWDAMTRALCGLALGLFLQAAAAQAGQASIGFEGPGEGPAPAEMPEDGYRIVMQGMTVSTAAKSGDGTDGPTEIESQMGARGQVEITRPGRPFVFVSLDWQAESGGPGVIVEGYSGDLLVGREQFVLPAPGGFVTFAAEVLAGQVLDRMRILPQRDRGGMGALDRVILEDAPAASETS